MQPVSHYWYCKWENDNISETGSLFSLYLVINMTVARAAIVSFRSDGGSSNLTNVFTKK